MRSSHTSRTAQELQGLKTRFGAGNAERSTASCNALKGHTENTSAARVAEWPWLLLLQMMKVDIAYCIWFILMTSRSFPGAFVFAHPKNISWNAKFTCNPSTSHLSLRAFEERAKAKDHCLHDSTNSLRAVQAREKNTADYQDARDSNCLLSCQTRLPSHSATATGLAASIQ